MRRAWLISAACAAVLLAGCGDRGAASGAGRELPAVGFVSFAPDPATDRTMEGVKDGLKAAGYEEGKQVRFVHNDAQGEISTIRTIAQKYVSEEVAVIVPMTTPCLVATAAATRDTGRKVVFAEVYDPYAAGVAESPDKHLPHVVGVASPPPVGPLIELLKEVLPRARRVGILYNPAETNSVVAVERAKRETRKRGLILVERTVSGSSEVQQATQSLVDEVDAILVIGDNTVNVSLEAAVGAATAARVPLFVADPTWIDRGVLAAMGPDFYQAGKVAGGLAAKVLAGTDPAGLPIHDMDATELALNRKTAEKLGIRLPESALKRAARVIE